MKITLDEADLRPLIKRVVAETLDRVEAQRGQLNGRLGYPEPEAAELLGIQRHVLRDARLRGEVRARLVGRRYIYSREELSKFLNPK